MRDTDLVVRRVAFVVGCRFEKRTCQSLILPRPRSDLTGPFDEAFCCMPARNAVAVWDYTKETKTTILEEEISKSHNIENETKG